MVAGRRSGRPLVGPAAPSYESGRPRTGCRALILTVDVDGAAVHDCLSRGAAGYIAKNSGAADICVAVRTVAAGGTVLSSTVQASVSAELRHRRAHERNPLGGRELEIHGMLAAGASAPDIAAAVAVGLRRGLIG